MKPIEFYSFLKSNGFTEEEIFEQAFKYIPNDYKQLVDSGNWLGVSTQNNFAFNISQEELSIIAREKTTKIYPDPKFKPIDRSSFYNYEKIPINQNLQYETPKTTENKLTEDIRVPKIEEVDNQLRNMSREELYGLNMPSNIRENPDSKIYPDPTFKPIDRSSFYNYEETPINQNLQYEVPKTTENKLTEDIRVPKIEEVDNQLRNMSREELYGLNMPSNIRENPDSNLASKIQPIDEKMSSEDLSKIELSKVQTIGEAMSGLSEEELSKIVIPLTPKSEKPDGKDIDEHFLEGISREQLSSLNLPNINRIDEHFLDGMNSEDLSKIDIPSLNDSEGPKQK